MLDRLNPAARHAVVLCVIAPLVALIGVFTLAVLTASGVRGVDWNETLLSGVDTAAVALATGIATWISLVISPVTRQYGVGAASPEDLDPDAEGE